MKKSIVLSIIFILIIGVLGGTVNAASASISASTGNVTVGQNVTIMVNFGDKVSTAQFKLSYDESKFEYKSMSGPGSYNAGTKTYGFFTMDGSDPTYNKVTLTFTAKMAGNVTFRFNSLKISTASQKNFAPSMSNTSVSVVAKQKEETTPDPTPTPTPDPTPTPTPTPTPNPGGNTNTNKNTVNTNTTKNTVNTATNTVNTIKNEIVENTTNGIEENLVDENQILDENTITSTEATQEEKQASILDYVMYIIIGLLAVAIIATVVIIIIKKRNQTQK